MECRLIWRLTLGNRHDGDIERQRFRGVSRCDAGPSGKNRVKELRCIVIAMRKAWRKVLPSGSHGARKSRAWN